MDPQVLRSEFAGTEYHSGLLTTWPSARKGTHTHTHFTEGHTTSAASPPLPCNRWCHRSLLMLSNTAPPGKDLHCQSPSCRRRWPAGPRTNPATEIKQPSLSAVRVCCCLVLLWTLNPVKVDWVVSGKEKTPKKLRKTGEQTSSEKVNVKCSSAVNGRKQATNWLLQGGTWQMSADRRAAQLVSVHYSPQKQLHVAAFMSLFNHNCPAIKRPPPSLWINLCDCPLPPSFSSYMCELSRCEAQTLYNLPLQTGSCRWPLAAPAHAYYARGPTPLSSHLSVSVFSCSFPWIPTASSRLLKINSNRFLCTLWGGVKRGGQKEIKPQANC